MISLMWLVNETLSFGGSLNSGNATTLGDIKRMWIGARASFEFKSPESDGSYSWLLLANETDKVPILLEENELRVVVRLNPVESPVTVISYTLEGHSVNFEVTLAKPASRILLSEVKDHFPGTGGVFLFKTPDQPTGFHWTTVVDAFSPVPASEDGKIVAQVKMKGTPKCVIEYVAEDGPSVYVRLQKHSKQVTLSDIRAFSPNPNGVHLFKVNEGDFFIWSVWVDGTSPVPNFQADTITCRVKPYGRFAMK